MIHCTTCNQPLKWCTCRSDEDLREITNIVASRWCTTCDKHYARCRCAEPTFQLLFQGQLLPLPPT